jgi:hypothetical protein
VGAFAKVTITKHDDEDTSERHHFVILTPSSLRVAGIEDEDSPRGHSGHLPHPATLPS